MTEKDRKAWKSAKGVDFDQQTVVCRAAICWSKYTTADPGPYKDDIVCSVKNTHTKLIHLSSLNQFFIVLS